jgi:DNA-binding GntR family transcriptional regulator
MQVRRKLEPVAAALVADAANEEQRSRLIACARAMEGCVVSGDLAGFFAADKAFDEILEDACPNRFITAALGSVQTHSRRLWYSTANPERTDRSISLHVAVIRAIHQGEVDEARETMAALIDYLSQK